MRWRPGKKNSNTDTCPSVAGLNVELTFSLTISATGNMTNKVSKRRCRKVADNYLVTVRLNEYLGSKAEENDYSYNPLDRSCAVFPTHAFSNPSS